ncbi:MAG: adenylate/guanylate cyclase domain-containing protein [Proteobacteria bacterium]|nr:adenylate/guanylate cyclase domain-containing protein [Pseudomonadota bacterium]
MGLHVGDALVGNIGSEERLEYTAIGPGVNLAARLEQLCKVYNSEIVVSHELMLGLEVSPSAGWLKVDGVNARGVERGLAIWVYNHERSKMGPNGLVMEAV